MTAVAPGRRPQSLREAAVAPMEPSGNLYRIVLVALGALVAAGIGAFVYQLVEGIGATGLSDEVFWGIYTVDLVTFIGFSYGGALVSAILRLTNASWRGPITRIAEATALVTLVVGAVFPIVHLGHPERAWRMLTALQINSPITWDMVAIVTYLIATVILFMLPVIPDYADLKDSKYLGQRRHRLFEWGSFGWEGNDEQRRILNRSMTTLAILIIPLAVMVHTVLSYAFSLTSRPGWHSTIFGPYFVMAAIYSGVAVVIIATAAYRWFFGMKRWIPEKTIVYMGYLMAALGVAYAYLLFTEITTEGYVGDESSETLIFALLLDKWALLFWGFVIAGLLVPIALIAIPKTRNVRGITIAAVLVAGSLFLKRFLMFIPPLTRPLIGTEVASYSPSWVEGAVTLGAAAAIPLGLMLLFKVVPVLSVHEIEEIREKRVDELKDVS